MNWVYVLRSSQTGNIYIGETCRLYRRWREHDAGKCKTTSQDDYNTVIGLYNVENNITFMKYREDMAKYDRFAYRCQREWGYSGDKQQALQLERHIAERYLLDRGINKYDIFGSFYLNEGKCENFCFGERSKNYVRDRPLCHCSYPCEIKMKKDQTKLYFTCPVPDWIDGFSIDEKCSFYQEFEPYRKILESYQNKPTAQQVFGIV
jgi:predicted GIY-YIG superfamily endonuclease